MCLQYPCPFNDLDVTSGDEFVVICFYIVTMERMLRVFKIVKWIFAIKMVNLHDYYGLLRFNAYGVVLNSSF